MKYVNDRFEELMNSVVMNREIIAQMKSDVDAFLPFFTDDPARLSRWGHYYFCDDDGGRLIFDLNSPSQHRCEVCKKTFTSDVLDGVWVYFYRNRAVVMALVAAVIYKATKEKRYLDDAVKVLTFYAENYHCFALHNKKNQIAEDYQSMPWGCGRMMPQGLNEAIVAIRFVQTVELLRAELSQEFLAMLYQKLFREMFLLLAPQATRIHNISCWNLAAIGVIGLAFQDAEMIEFAFHSEYNIHQQLAKGVTADYFWYEGSIHYNFFLLEGVSYLFLFSKIYEYDFGEKSSEIFTNMFIQAANYAFDNQYLPNPNDGWPDLNLQTFSYVYHTVARALGEESAVANITKIIELAPAVRTRLPLSEPYYCQNQVCLEQLLFNIDFDYTIYTPLKRQSHNFPKSNFTILRNDNWNVFLKYGLNGKSHAHPDLMTVEVVFKNHRVSRDLSNAGYRARLCNEWHRKTLCHNTVCYNGQDITSVSHGECLHYEEQRICATAKNVYEGIDYTRTLQITNRCYLDQFQVTGDKEGIYDYSFHLESDFTVTCGLLQENASLGFEQNGYQHVLETKRVVTNQKDVVFEMRSGELRLKMQVSLVPGQELYLLKTMDNPVNQTRQTVLIRSRQANPRYCLQLEAD